MAWRGPTSLQWAIGLSLAAHVLLLGFRWIDPAGFDRVFRDTPLEVILVNARSSEAPAQAQAVAQAALAGGGEQAGGRATSPLPAAARAELGKSNDVERSKSDCVLYDQH